jgi:hypothetical protein
MTSMAARTIVTFHPDVTCDVCGRRLLRGERPDVFLSGAQRQTVCELCTPRATHEGWLRETQERTAGLRAERPQRGRSLLGRLRQLRDPAPPTDPGPAEDGRSAVDRSATGRRTRSRGSLVLEEEWPGSDDQWAGAQPASPAAEDWVESGEHAAAGNATDMEIDHIDSGHTSAGEHVPANAADPTYTGVGVHRALEVFNAGEQPRRVAGVARALGAACVKAAPVAGAEDVVAIVVAWELCWYRYEIDLRDEAAGVRLAAQGTELEELAEDDRIANVAANEHGELSLLET